LITACYNAEATIGRTFQSVLAQQGDFELEHVIQDGGSMDGTIARIEDYIRVAKHRVSFASEPDRGFYDAINKAISRTSGDIIALINADDSLADVHVLEDVVRLFRDNSSLQAVYADLDYVSLPRWSSPMPELGAYVRPRSARDAGLQAEPRVRIDDQPFLEESAHQQFETVDYAPPVHQVVRRWVAGNCGKFSFRRGWMPPHPTVYVRREVYDQFGAYRLDMGSAADYEWMLRVFEKHRVKAAYLPRVTVKMLTGGQSNVSWKARWRANRKDREAWEMNGLKPSIWLSLLKPARKLRQFRWRTLIFAHRR
jgi:glycosyltransferase